MMRYPPLSFTSPSWWASNRRSSALGSRRCSLGLSAIFIMAGALSTLVSTPLFACETIIFSSGGANTAQYEYDSASGNWVLVSSWSDPAALDYVPQPGDQYEVFESQGLWVLYVNDQSHAPPGQPPDPPNPPGPPTDPYGAGIQCDDDDDDSTELPRLFISGVSINWSGGGGTGTGYVYNSGGGAAEGPVRLGKIVVSAYAWYELTKGAAGLASITYEAALRDIRYWRDAGIHIPHCQGCLIDWANAEVDWDLYGAGDPNLTPRQVLQNFIDFIEGGGG